MGSGRCSRPLPGDCGLYAHTYLIDLQRLGDAFQDRGAERLAGKEAAEQLKRRGADHQGMGRRHALQAGGDIGRLAEGQRFRSRPAPNLPYHDETGMDAEAHGQLHPALLRQAR